MDGQQAGRGVPGPPAQAQTAAGPSTSGAASAGHQQGSSRGGRGGTSAVRGTSGRAVASRGGRGGFGSRGGHRGGVAVAAPPFSRGGAAPGARGGRGAFSNRSVVFNKTDSEGGSSMNEEKRQNHADDGATGSSQQLPFRNDSQWEAIDAYEDEDLAAFLDSEFEDGQDEENAISYFPPNLEASTPTDEYSAPLTTAGSVGASPFSLSGLAQGSTRPEAGVASVPATSGIVAGASFPEQNGSSEPSGRISTNALGGSKEVDEDRRKRFENLPKQNRFFEMRAERESLRTRYIASGVLPDPDKPQDLAAAKTFTGACTEMCPEFEREEREFQNEGDPLEMFPGTSRLDPRLAVKIYRRPAAGRELPLPEDVRPPSTLRETLDYLFHDLLPADPGSSHFTAVQPFMWNRTRAIRQDFIVQGERGAFAIECHERIARYHILCLHWRGGVDAEGWSEQQELEQLRKTIRSLTEFYEDLRQSTGRSSPNEAEFRAYNLLLHMSDPETLREVEALPGEISDAAPVRAALKLRGYAQRSNHTVRRGRPANTEATMNLWTRFFGELRRKNNSISYLLACLAENAFSSVRAGALKAMGKTYLSQHAPLPVDYLQRILGMDSLEEVRSFTVALGCEEVFAEGRQDELIGLRLNKANDDVPFPPTPFSRSIVEAKRASWTCQDVVDGKACGAAPLLAVPKAESKQELLQSPQMTTKSTVDRTSAVSAVAVSEPGSSLKPSITSQSNPATTFKAPNSSKLSAVAPSFTPLSSKSATASSTSAASNTSGIPTIISSGFGQAQPTTANIQSPPTAKEERPIASLSKPSFGVFSSPATSTFVASAQQEREMTTPASMPSTSLPASQTAVKTREKNTASPNASRQVAQEKRPHTSFPTETETSTMKPSIAQQSTSINVSKQRNAKRTLDSVANGLLLRLLNEFLSQKVTSVGEQACLREARVRHRRQRSSLLQRVSNGLKTQMFDDFVEDSIASLAGETIAEEQSKRKLRRRAFCHWRQMLGQILQQKKQTARLEEVRARLQARDLNPTPRKARSNLSVMDTHQSNDRGDSTLEAKLRKANEDRRNLWLPSTFFWAVAAQMDRITSSDIDNWTIALCVADEAGASSTWLKFKLSLAEEWHTKIALRSGLLIEAVDLSKAPAPSAGDVRDLGLVIFELDAARTSGTKASAKSWQLERDRLQDLSKGNLVRHSRFVPKLIIVSWTNNDDALNAELTRKAVFRQLGLGATDPLRFVWGKIELWEAGNSEPDPQHGFEDCLRSVLSPVEWNSQMQTVNFDEMCNAVSDSWRAMLERIESSHARLSYLMQHAVSDETAAQDASNLTVETFAIVTALTQRVLDDVASVSIFVADGDPGSSQHTFVVLPSAKNVIEEKTVGKTPFALAKFQLENVAEQVYATQRDDSAVLLLRSWLAKQADIHQGFDFPWLAYFSQLLHLALVPMHEVWLEAVLPSITEIQSEMQPAARLSVRAANEIQRKVRGLIERHHLLAAVQTEQASTCEPVSSPRDSDSLLVTSGPRKGSKRRVSSPRATSVDVYDNSTTTTPPSRNSKVRKIGRSSTHFVSASGHEAGGDVASLTSAGAGEGAADVRRVSRMETTQQPMSSSSTASPAVASLKNLIASANSLLTRPGHV